MTLPLIRDPETGDPIGFIIDAEGRYVDRGKFAFTRGTGIEPRSQGLKVGDRVYVHGELVYTEGQVTISTPRGPATKDALGRIEEGAFGRGADWHWGGVPVDFGPRPWLRNRAG